MTCTMPHAWCLVSGNATDQIVSLLDHLPGVIKVAARVGPPIATQHAAAAGTK